MGIQDTDIKFYLNILRES